MVALVLAAIGECEWLRKRQSLKQNVNPIYLLFADEKADPVSGGAGSQPKSGMFFSVVSLL